MDLGIAGKTAIVCASTQGLGRACAEALLAEGVDVTINGRHEDRTRDVAAELAGLAGRDVGWVAADITTRDGRERLIAACESPDILITNNAGPTPGAFQELDEEDWLAALNTHMLAPLALVRAVLPGMRSRKFGRIVTITSAMVTRPNAGMEISTGPRTGLTAVLKAVSRDAVRDNVTINNMLPERIDTPRQIQMAHRIAKREGVDYDEARRIQAQMVAAGRLGLPEEFGAACAFLCSVQAAFIAGQNLRLDGGSYPGLV
ncbi:SDR family oxidoreductase [Microbaculum marinum]|uniref:SDR family oxidoreductase n=1 Tax=Microbaculum marinum TaxID=1764581 RepID=A0AAW9RPF4_9HYPH